MNNLFRSTSAIIPSAAITFFLFLGMYWLVSNNNQNRISTDDNFSIDFTPLKIDEKINTTRRQQPKKPEKPLKQPKVQPKLNITQQKLDRTPPAMDIPPLDANFGGTGPNIGRGGYSNRDASGNGDIVPLVTIAPNYPRKPLIAKIEGWVKIEFTITATGGVINPHVVSAKPARMFNREALRAISKYRFKPKYVNGVAVEQVATQTIEFKLRKE